MRTSDLKRVRPLLLIVVTTALLVFASAALAATFVASNDSSGFVDESEVDLPVDISGPGVVTDVNVAVDFQKIATQDCANPIIIDEVYSQSWAYSDEIYMLLTSPAGTTVQLVYNWTDDLGPTYGVVGETREEDLVVDRLVVTFDDEASEQVGGPHPVPGTFRPEEPLSAFDGEEAAGTWTLTVRDSMLGSYACYYGFTLTVETDYVEPVDEKPTDEEPEPAAPMSCTTGDRSLNADHCGRPVAIFAQNGGFAIYGIDINTGWGSLASEITAEQIEAVGIPTDGPVAIAEGQNPYNYQPFTLYRLPSGEFQLNTYYWDGKPYAVKWEGNSPVKVVTW